jgi:hypothetical protein
MLESKVNPARSKDWLRDHGEKSKGFFCLQDPALPHMQDSSLARLAGLINIINHDNNNTL